jgi:hypothetical protein
MRLFASASFLFTLSLLSSWLQVGAETAQESSTETGPCFEELSEGLFRTMLVSEKMCALNRAFAGLWLREDLPAANRDLREAYAEILGASPAMTPQVADEKAKWQMRTWVRIYYLFGKGASRFPARLEEDIETKVEDLLWNYALAKSTLARADLGCVWFLQGSENHDLMDLGNAFLALQALQDLPPYRERLLSDGQTAAEHVAAWTDYYVLYCKERARRGLFVEIGSPTYGKYLIPEIVNIHDFARSEELRQAAKTLLDLTWADWSLEQLNGIRGGGKSRCYQGNYSRQGGSDAYYTLGKLVLGDPEVYQGGRYNHPILGYGPILASSVYRLPAIIRKLATSPLERGEYAYRSRRVGKMTLQDPLPPLGEHSCWYAFDATDTALVRYTWCTPNHIMGCFLVDPQLGVEFNVRRDKVYEMQHSYTAISAQNRWQGVIFDTGPDARIFPQCVGTPQKEKEGLTVTYHQQVAVQYENVMMVQMNRTRPANSAMRLYVAPGMRERLVEREGWRFLEEGESYCAFRPFSLESATATVSATWEEDTFLRLSEPYAPVVFVTGRKNRYPTLSEFQEYVLSHRAELDRERFHYRFLTAGRGSLKHLAFWAHEPGLPEIDGVSIDLCPDLVYDSLWLRSDLDGLGATLRFGDEKMVFDMR